MGKRVLSSSFSLSGLDEFFDATERGYNRSCGSEIAGGLELGPLRMILVDGREAEVSGVSGLANERTEEGTKVVLDRAPQEMMEEGDEGGGLSWQSSCLAKFSRCLEMPTEGFEGEILFLLRRMKERKIRKGKKGKLEGRKKRKFKSSKFKRELRKLEWTVNYLGGGKEEATALSLNEDTSSFLEC